MSARVQLQRHIAQLRACADCPDMIRPVVVGNPVVSPVMLIGQAPGVKEGPAGKPFAWTAGKTMFGWFQSLGATRPTGDRSERTSGGDHGLGEDQFRNRVYMAAVCRCFPGKAPGGGDRVPSPTEIETCSRHLAAEIRILSPRLVIPVGKLAIAQLVPGLDKLTEIIGVSHRTSFAGTTFDLIALPHPSGASTWHRTEPGKTLLQRALAMIAQHEAWQSLLDPSKLAATGLEPPPARAP